MKKIVPVDFFGASVCFSVSLWKTCCLTVFFGGRRQERKSGF